jgi:sorting and assembly machinery component 37
MTALRLSSKGIVLRQSQTHYVIFWCLHADPIYSFVSFLQSSAGPLIDLSLYISSENYNSTTSSAYTAILPWYLNYTIPPKRRELARSRTSHLGLSSLEATSTGQDGIKNGPGSLGSNFEAAKRDAGIPTQDNALNMGRKAGLQGLLSAPVYAARFRLDTLTNELLGPLSGLLGNEQYLLGGDNPSSLDCVAFGYLALMFYPSLPQAWLQEAMRARFPRLVAYLERIRRDVLGDQDINPADIWAICSGCTDHPGIQERSHRLDLNLPWSPVPSRPFSLTAATAAREVISALPLFSIIFPRRAIIQADTVKVSDRVQSSLPSQLAVATFFTTAGAIVVALAGMAIRHRRSPREGDLIFWALRPRTGLGEAGNILSILGAPMSAGVGGVAM